MSLSLHDFRLKQNIEKLNTIVARRNDLLQEIFHMMQSRENFASVLHSTGKDDPALQDFLKRFDLSSNLEQGSIANLREGEMWFFDEDIPQTYLRSPSSRGFLDGMLHAPTRKQSSPIEPKSPSFISVDRLPEAIVERVPLGKVEGDQVIESIHSKSLLADVGGLTAETQDKGDGEPILVTSSTLSADDEHGFLREILPTSAHALSPVSVNEKQEALTPVKTLSRSSSLALLADRRSRSEIPDQDGDQLTERINLLNPATVPTAVLTSKFPPPNENSPSYEIHTSLQDLVIFRDNEALVDIAPDPGTDYVNDEPVFPADSAKKGVQSSSETFKPAYIQIALPPSIQEEIFIPTPLVAGEDVTYNFDVDVELGLEKSQSSLKSVDSRPFFNPRYSIPSLDLLPAEFTRKVKPTKRRKDKMWEKDGKKDRDDTIPLGLNRWNAILTTNPVWRKVSRANKCLSTREWGVAMTELRLIRTIQRIDQLKEEGRWSFRQPKKQRSVGGLVKTYWDHLLDEMKWMRIDFREERRWKIAVAYSISAAVLQWHLSKTQEERQRNGICVKWQSSRIRVNQSSTPQSNESGNTDQEQTPFVLGHHSSGDENGQNGNTHDTLDVLEPALMIEDALVNSASNVQLKSEEVDDRTAIELLHLCAEEFGRSFDDSHAEYTGALQPDNRLKSTSNDPLFGGTKSSSQSTNGDAEVDLPIVDLKSAKVALAPFRERIAYSEHDQFFVALDHHARDDMVPDFFDTPDLGTLFPELQPLGLLDVPIAPGPAEGRKRIDKRIDRDDPNRRAEDINYTKLYPTGRFMHAKPTLIGPLQPSKRWKDGKWLPLEQTPISSDTESNIRISEDNTSELFDGRSNSSNFALQLHTSSFKDKESKREASTHAWNSADDALLRSLVDKYSMNWPLISECFNSSRLSTLTDRRTAADCLHHWKEKWGSERKLTSIEIAQSAGDTSSLSNSSMTTRGIKRLASSSISSPTIASVAGNTETRKRRRHLLLQDSIRKAGKKRAEGAQKALANQRKPPQVHETHNQFNKLPKLSPAELSRMKAERDFRESQDMALARKRQGEQIQQTLLHAQRGSSQGQIQQQPSQGQPPQAAPQSQPAASSQQLQQQQLAQLQQLQQQANQNSRQNGPTAVLPNRPMRPPAASNLRQVGQQIQLLQQQRSIQVPMQVQAGASPIAPSSLLSGAQAPGNNAMHPSGASFYGLPPNVTQEQFLIAIQTAQQQQQQSQSSLSNFSAQQP